MKIIACIAVRMRSKRLPGKALAELCGKPMLLRLIERLRTARLLDEILVCTSTHPDDKIIMEKAREWGVKAMAGSEDDVLARFIQAAEQEKADVILRVTGDNPFTDPENIDRMISHHLKTKAEYTRTKHLPLGATAEVMSTSMLLRLRQLIPNPDQSEYLLFYAFDPEHFHCEVLTAPPELNRPFYSLTVDTPADLELARGLYCKLGQGPDRPGLREVVAHLDNDPEYRPLSPNAPIKMPFGKIMRFSEYLSWSDEQEKKSRLKYQG